MIAICPSVFAWAGRGLDADERKVLFLILGTALAVRLLVIAAMLLTGIPEHNDLSIGALRGDEQYYLSRAIRARDIMLGFGDTKYDAFVVSDEYGYTSYLALLTWVQVICGPTPYSMRLVNAVLFLAGAVLLFRIARAAFGSVAALVALAALVLLPSLVVSLNRPTTPGPM